MRYRFLLVAVLVAVISPMARAADDSKVVKSWKFPADAGAWKSLNNVELKSAENQLIVTAKGDDPQLATNVEAPAGWKTLVVKAKFRGQINGQLYWTTAGQPATSEEASRRFNARGRGENEVEFTVFFNHESAGKISPGRGLCREIHAIAS